MRNHHCDQCGRELDCYGEGCLVCENDGDVCSYCLAAYYQSSCVACHERTPNCLCEEEEWKPLVDWPRQEELIVGRDFLETDRIHWRQGDTFKTFAGAPGTGHVLYCITRVEPTGLYGYEIENTIRELEPWETV